MIKAVVDKKDLRRLQKALDPKRYAAAMVNTLNSVVRVVNSQQRRNVQAKHVVRAPAYTLGSLRVNEARVSGRTGRVGYAEVGSISPYLPIQEEGGTIRARRRRIPIPTLTGRGGDVRNIIPQRLRIRRMKAGSPASKYFVLLPARKFVQRKGRPSPRLKQPGIFYRNKGKGLVMVRDLSYKRFKLKPTRWHSDAVKKFGKRSLMEQVFVREAKKLLGQIR